MKKDPRILVSGATGNVGRAVLKHLADLTPSFKIDAGVREAKATLHINGRIYTQVVFDFLQADHFESYLSDYDLLFLLRPPKIADVEKVFVPLIDAAKAADVKGIVFLSVQGAEASRWIPHNKIEKAIKRSEIPFVFLRPGYFMQNLTTALRDDLVNYRQIILPAGKARFNWTDVDDIGKVAAIALSRFDEFANRALVITGREQLNFEEVAEQLRLHWQRDYHYRRVNLTQYFLHERKKGTPFPFIMVKIALHYLPRFSAPLPLSNVVKEVTGDDPQTLASFLQKTEAPSA